MTPMDFKDRQTVECRVDSLAFGGEGVGRVGGMVVFVEGALPGERTAVEILHRGRKFLRGRAAEILDFSPDRVSPPCRLFGRCGGCALQHLRYESQLDWKRRQVLDILARIGGIEGIPCGAAVPSPAPYGYRNSIRLHRLPGRPPRYGFYCRDNRTLVEVRRCEIAMKAINHAIPGLAKPAGGVRGADEILLRAGADGGVVAHPGRGGARRAGRWGSIAWAKSRRPSRVSTPRSRVGRRRVRSARFPSGVGTTYNAANSSVISIDMQAKTNDTTTMRGRLDHAALR